MATPAGIPSFRAMCPPSPGRGDPPAIWPLDILEDSIGSGIQDLGGIQGVRVPSQRTLVTTPGQMASRSKHMIEPPLMLSRSQPSLPGLTDFAPDLDDVTIRLRSCQILMPSNGSDNDAIRIRCNGKGLRGPLMPLIPRMKEVNPVDLQLRHTLSEASFPSGSSRRFAPGFANVEPLNMAQTWAGRGTTTPRMETQRKPILKGVVRKASKLQMTYPGLQPIARSSSPPRERTGKVQFVEEVVEEVVDCRVAMRQSKAELLRSYTFRSSSPKTPSKKMGNYLSSRNEDDLAKMAAQKSSQCRDALFNLRRIGKNEPVPDDSASPSIPGSKRKKPGAPDKKKPAAMSPLEMLAAAKEQREKEQQGEEPSQQSEEPTQSTEAAQEDQVVEIAMSPEQKAKVEKETSMMVATLNGLRDDCCELREHARLLSALQDPVTATGGSRHPTAVIAYRNLAVVKRKAELLEPIEVRLAKQEVVCKQKEELFKQVTEDASPSLEDMYGIRQFVAKNTHKPEENPADADKSSFDIFVNSFGIHKNHQHFERMMELANTTAIWWAEKTLELAQNGGESEEIKRNMDVVTSIGADKSALAQADETMKACTELLGARLAEKCLATALKLQEKDKLKVERSSDAQPQSAKDAAAAINDDMRRAVSLGAKTEHPALQEAKQIAVALELEEKVRYGLEALLVAQKLQKQDTDAATAYEKKEGVPPVGPASVAADTIDKTYKEAVTKGASESHEHMKKAAAISKELRDTDGIRKRTAARAKRTQ